MNQESMESLIQVQRRSFASLNMGEANDIGFKKREKGFQSSDMEIGLVTDNVEEAFDKAISAGAVTVKKPIVKPWGQTVGYVRDINGFLIEMCSPIG